MGQRKQRKQPSTIISGAKDYEVLPNGVIVVKRPFTNILEPYKKEDEIPNYLKLVDHSLAIDSKKDYKRALLAEQVKFNTLVRQLAEHRLFLITAFQGRDAAGKSGATIRMAQATRFDWKLLDVVPIDKPTEEELSHPYLWRFFKHDRMPAYGQVRIFDRTWQERLLVERVKELTSPRQLQESYEQIRAFEWSLESHGGVLVKIWLDISKDEQWKRFQKRATTSQWKLSKDDMEARKKWDEYTDAFNELVFRTATASAPQYIIAADCKLYSRVVCLQIHNKVLEETLKTLKKNSRKRK